MLPGSDHATLRHRSTVSLRVYCRHGHHRIVELLLRSKRFSVNAVDNARMSPLHLAALGGHAEVIRILLECPDINVVQFSTGLSRVVPFRFFQHAKNKDGKRAIDFCKENPNHDWQLCTELIERFLQKPVGHLSVFTALASPSSFS